MLSGRRFFKGIGEDAAGIITEIGSGVGNVAVGDAVFGWTTHKQAGAIAEYVDLPAERIARIPQGLSFPEAAALPVAASTAYVALFEKSKIQSGDKVLITGCAGGVGHFAVQMAKSIHAEIWGVCAGKDGQFVQELGATHIVDYQQVDLHAYIKASAGFDVIFDAAGVIEYPAIQAKVKKHFVSININSGWDIVRSILSSRYSFLSVDIDTHTLKSLAELWEKGLIKAHIGYTAPIADAISVIDALEQKRLKVQGKVVLTNE
jgi:NADPH:quinone reductase-like Zn-dependent oxidoreductase